MTSCALLLALLLGSQPAGAQDGIYNVSVSDSTFEFSPANSANSSAVSAVGHDAQPTDEDEFIARFALNVNADASSGASVSASADASLVVKFEVRSSRNYVLNVTTALVGELTRIADNFGCSAFADVSGVGVFSSHLVTSGRLDIDDPGLLFPDIFDEQFQFNPVSDATIRVRNPNPTEFHTLVLNYSANVVSNSCEVAARLGAGNATTQDCSACVYPGVPARIPDLDGLFVSVLYTPLECGDGELDVGEDCDLGKSVNGFGTCCTPDCKFEENDVPCTDNLFCNGDDRCQAGACIQPFGTPCQMGPQENICFGVCEEATDSCDFSTCFATPPPTATAPPTTTASPIPTPTVIPASCPLPYNSESQNVNGPNCAFCEVLGSGQCASDCIGPEACLCPPPGEDGHAECCAEGPCCTGCPETNSPACTLLTCVCNPDIDACCKTVCPCTGDCNGDGGVAVNELVTGVRISRDQASPQDCISFHTEREGAVSTADIVRGIEAALEGCNVP